MSNRALIVGVSEYAPLLNDLPSSVVEVEAWRRLLIDCYGFPPYAIETLCDQYARRATVVSRFQNLFANVHSGDLRVFVFCGHGTRMHRDETSGRERDLQDEGLVCYPGAAADARDVALFDDELASLYAAASVQPGTIVTFIFDTCFAGGIDLTDKDLLRSSDGIGHDLLSKFDRRSVGLIRVGFHLGHFRSAATPLVIAAAGEASRALENDESGTPRSLFSARATAALRCAPSLTYSALLQSIVPGMRYAVQEPVLLGDRERRERPFFH